MKKRLRLFSVLCLALMLLNIVSVFAGATEADTADTTAEATDVEATDAEAADAEAAEPTIAPTEVPDPYSGLGSYMAFVMVQTTTWVYRDDWTNTSTGWGSDNFNTVFNNETSAATTSIVNDAVLDGDGEYTISIENISLEGSTDWNMVAVSTNLPLDGPIQITGGSLKYDNKTISTAPIQKADNKKYVQMMFINQYDNTMKDTVNTMVPADGANLYMTFTVEGFGYAKAEPTAAAEPTEAAAATDNTTDTTGTDNSTNTADKADAEGGLSTPVIIAIIAAAVVVVAIIVVVVAKKKKK